MSQVYNWRPKLYYNISLYSAHLNLEVAPNLFQLCFNNLVLNMYIFVAFSRHSIKTTSAPIQGERINESSAIEGSEVDDPHVGKQEGL